MQVCDLQLQHNLLSGTLPAEIGEIGSSSPTQRLDLYSNPLSGELPTQLGKLTALTYLDVGLTNLNGTLDAIVLWPPGLQVLPAG